MFEQRCFARSLEHFETLSYEYRLLPSQQFEPVSYLICETKTPEIFHEDFQRLFEPEVTYVRSSYLTLYVLLKSSDDVTLSEESRISLLTCPLTLATIKELAE